MEDEQSISTPHILQLRHEVRSGYKGCCRCSKRYLPYYVGSDGHWYCEDCGQEMVKKKQIATFGGSRFKFNFNHKRCVGDHLGNQNMSEAVSNETETIKKYEPHLSELKFDKEQVERVRDLILEADTFQEMCEDFDRFGVTKPLYFLQTFARRELCPHCGRTICVGCPLGDVAVEAENNWVVSSDGTCPITGMHCDDECCPPGAICNMSGTVVAEAENEQEKV